MNTLELSTAEGAIDQEKIDNVIRTSLNQRHRLDRERATIRAKLDADVARIRGQERHILHDGGIDRFSRFAADLPLMKREMKEAKKLELKMIKYQKLVEESKAKLKREKEMGKKAVEAKKVATTSTGNSWGWCAQLPLR